MSEPNQNKILLHACCGICSGQPILYLRELGFEPIVFFFNPNIQPIDEYEKRLEAQKQICTHFNCGLIEADYDAEAFEKIVSGLECEPEGGLRCQKCFELRLDRTAQKLLELKLDTFTTSIVISPHKNYKLISDMGKNIAQKYGLNYLDIDFKKKDGFLKSNKIAKELDLYRQNYCGCTFSK